MNIVKKIKMKKLVTRRKAKIKEVGKIAASVATGAAIGAAGGVLFAPQSGRETREDIANKVVDTKDAVVDKAYEAKYTLENKIDNAKEKLTNITPFNK